MALCETVLLGLIGQTRHICLIRPADSIFSPFAN